MKTKLQPMILVCTALFLVSCSRDASALSSGEIAATALAADLRETEQVNQAKDQANQATEQAIQATQAALEQPTDIPIPVVATQPTEEVSSFADMGLNHWAYQGRKWAIDQGYATACSVEGGDPTQVYACPDKPMQIWELIESGVRFYHDTQSFRPPEATGRTFDDPDFHGHEGEAWAEDASRQNILPDWFLTNYPNPHYIGPFRTATRCDGHVFVRVLLYKKLEFPNWDLLAERQFSDYYKAGRLCNQAAEANLEEGIFDPGPASLLEPERELDWGYWSVLLYQADSVRTKNSDPAN